MLSADVADRNRTIAELDECSRNVAGNQPASLPVMPAATALQERVVEVSQRYSDVSKIIGERKNELDELFPVWKEFDKVAKSLERRLEKCRARVAELSDRSLENVDPQLEVKIGGVCISLLQG